MNGNDQMSDFNTHDDRHEGEVPAAPSSPLAGLRAERERIEAELHLDLRVPRWEIPVYVRYRSPEQDEIKRINSNAEKAKDKDGQFAEAILLAQCCLGVFQRDENGKPIGEPGDWPKFDGDLAEMLGKPGLERSVAVVRALFFTDGDIMAQAATLTRWAGFAEAQAIEEYEGN
ncbi:hypothetical protein [Microbacterium sp. KNMS]